MDEVEVEAEGGYRFGSGSSCGERYQPEVNRGRSRRELAKRRLILDE